MGFEINNGVLNRYTDENNCKDVVIPDGVTHIGDYAFMDCNYMTSVTIPASVTYIQSTAFYECTRLKKVVFASDNIEIESDAFEDTPWWKNQKGEMVIAAGTLLKYSGQEANLVIPEGVVYIAEGVFKGHTEIESITFPSSLRKIGYAAFGGCTSLKKVDVPLGVTDIGRGCFSGCSGLVDVKLPEGIKKLEGTFQHCTHLKEFNIPNTVEVMNDEFYGCSLMESITLPESLAELEGWFKDTKITNVNIPSKVRILEPMYFNEQIEAITVDENNEVFTSLDGVVYSKDMRCLHIYPCAKTCEEFIVPESVRYISWRAFSHTKYLKRVVLHKDIIYDQDYDGCKMNRHTVSSSWRFPFHNCYSIEKVEGLPYRFQDSHYFDLPSVYADKIIDTILNGKKDDRTKFIHYTTAESADIIARKATATLAQSGYTKKNVSNLTEMFDYHRKYISARTFSEFYKVIIDKKADSCLGQISFASIIALKEGSGDPDVELIRSVMESFKSSPSGKAPDAKQFCKIEKGEWVGFEEHTGLTELKLPSNVKKIGYFCFSDYYNYKNQQYENVPDYSEIKKIIIPKATEDIRSLELFAGLEEIVVDPQNKVFFSENGLLLERTYNGVGLWIVPGAAKKICIPKCCSFIYSIVDLSNVEEITIEQGNDFFEYNDGYLIEKKEETTDLIFVRKDIVDIIIPDGVTYFSLSNNNNNKDHIESIIMPDSVTSASGVRHCKNLTSIRLSGGIKELDCFAGCESLKEVVIPEGVQTIAEDCFENCKSLEKVAFPSTLKRIYANAFSGCSSLTEVSVPEGVKTAASSFPKKCRINNSEFVGGIQYAANFPIGFDEEAHSFSFKSGVTEIPEEFFRYDGNQFFHNVQHYDSVNISDTVTKLVPQQLSNFEQINVDNKNKKYSSEDGVLFDKKKSVLLRFPVFKRCDEYVVPNTVKRIEDNAFEWCCRIKSVIIPEGVSKIGFSAFALCDELTQVKVPYTATEIGKAAFVTEDNCNKNQRRDVTLLFYKDDIVVPLKLKRNWDVYTEEQKLSEFINNPSAHEKNLSALKDADYKLAAAMIMYFLFDEKGAAEPIVKANLQTVIDVAIAANSTGVIKRLLGDNMLTDSQKNECMKMMNNHMD